MWAIDDEIKWAWSICSFPFQQGVEVLIVRTCTHFQSRFHSLKYLCCNRTIFIQAHQWLSSGQWRLLGKLRASIGRRRTWQGERANIIVERRVLARNNSAARNGERGRLQQEHFHLNTLTALQWIAESVWQTKHKH